MSELHLNLNTNNETATQPNTMIAAKEWTDPATRAQFEERFGVALADSGHEFGPQEARRMASVAVLGEAVVTAMKRDYGEDAGLRLVTSRVHDPQTGKMAAGHMVLGAADRATAERFQPGFVREMNAALEGLESSFRLGQPTR